MTTSIGSDISAVLSERTAKTGAAQMGRLILYEEIFD